MSLFEIPPLFRKASEPVESTAAPNASAPSDSKLKLFRGSDDAGKYVSSPFVTKVEFRLRLADVPYALDAGAPWLGPKGKIPYVEVSGYTEGDKPLMLGDSTLIFNHLIGDKTVADLNSSLTASEKSRDLGLRSLLEDKLYFYHMRECWVDNYYLQRDQALWAVPLPIRVFVGKSVYKKVTTTLYGQGVGRFTAAEVDSFRREIWQSFNDLLDEVRQESGAAATTGPFWVLGGAEPTEADIVLYSFVSSIMSANSCPGSQKMLKGMPAIMDYAGRIHDQYFPDYVKWEADETPAARL